MTDVIENLVSPPAEERLTNPEIFKQIWAVGPHAIDAYLMGLAAVQRGLKVVFFGDNLNARNALGGGGNAKSPEPKLLTISDSKKIYFSTELVAH